MNDVITHAADPVVDYVFGGFCLLLMAAMGTLLWYGIRAWRFDQKEAAAIYAAHVKEAAKEYAEHVRKAAEKYSELAEVTVSVVSQNSASNDKLATSLDRVGQHQDELNRRLLSRPCLKNGIERE